MFKRQTVLAIALTCLSSVALAENLPKYYPENFQFEGVIDEINEKSRSLLVEDYVLRCESDVMVHTLKRPGEHFGVLRTGQKIGVRFQNPAAPKRIVTDIWVLPAD